MSILGHVGGHERQQRHRSPSVEIILDEEPNTINRTHVQGRSRRDSTTQSYAAKVPINVRKSSPQQYERTLNRKYAELKRLVLEAVGFSGQSSLFNRQAKQLVQQYSPRRVSSPRARDDKHEVPSQSGSTLKNSKSLDGYQRVHNHRRYAEPGNSFCNDNFGSDINVNCSNQQERSVHVDHKRVTFDDSYRAPAGTRLTQSYSHVTSSRPRIWSRSDDVIDRQPSNHAGHNELRRSVPHEHQLDSDQRDHVVKDPPRSKSGSQVTDEQDVIYYTKQIPRRKIKASSRPKSSGSVDTGLSEFNDTVASAKKKYPRRRVKSGSVGPMNIELKDPISSVSLGNEEDDSSAEETRDDCRRSMTGKRFSTQLPNKANKDDSTTTTGRLSRSHTTRAKSGGGARDEGESPARKASSSPVNKTTTAEYHLKFVENDDIRKWLREKNKMERRRLRDEKRLQRAKRLEEKRKEDEKMEKKQVSDSVVRKWMEEKKKELKQKQQEIKNQDVVENARQRGSRNQTRNVRCRASGSRPSQVPAFSRLGNYDSFPGASTWTKPGNRQTEVQRRMAYQEYLKRDRHGGGDDGKMTETNGRFESNCDDAAMMMDTDSDVRSRHLNGVTTNSTEAQGDARRQTSGTGTDGKRTQSANYADRGGKTALRRRRGDPLGGACVSTIPIHAPQHGDDKSMSYKDDDDDVGGAATLSIQHNQRGHLLTSLDNIADSSNASPVDRIAALSVDDNDGGNRRFNDDSVMENSRLASICSVTGDTIQENSLVDESAESEDDNEPDESVGDSDNSVN